MGAAGVSGYRLGFMSNFRQFDDIFIAELLTEHAGIIILLIKGK